ncbi:hypothetical protein EDB81DRAFT_655940 [Dactylonectria macrodidyma]|uniref:F-box domain-containing protein n=1 Tax=Dactylonectria macrodidyma TaxID=307937 RepID=A0A9P9EGY4_9HYPO|nr:hypothetical protein EDB81DRAFT_655940 [Dactylonectria macrodidyma]
MSATLRDRSQSLPGEKQSSLALFVQRASSPASTARTVARYSQVNISDLPPELHYAIFEWLDPIDGTCLGLTNSYCYVLYRRLYSGVPLGTGRVRPNDMEWVWRTTPCLSLRQSARPCGQFCGKCGPSRCQLYRHIREWFDPDMEYCSVGQKFGPAAPEVNKRPCFRNRPRQPRSCGRHAWMMEKHTTHTG